MSDQKRPVEPTAGPEFRPQLFAAQCPLCSYRASAIRAGVEQECLALHLVYAHIATDERS